MNNLYIINEIITNSLNHYSLHILSLFSVLAGILVIISKNPVVSILFLIGLFLTIASYLMILGVNFIGLSYLLVYVGAVSILFLFILMLINIRVSELVDNSSNSIPLAILIGIFFNISLTRIMVNKLDSNLDFTNVFNIKNDTVFYIGDNTMYSNMKYIWSSLFNNELSFVTSYAWDSKLAETFHITSIGNIIYTSYPMWLIITSIILLLAMIGSILITIKG